MHVLFEFLLWAFLDTYFSLFITKNRRYRKTYYCIFLWLFFLFESWFIFFSDEPIEGFGYFMGISFFNAFVAMILSAVIMILYRLCRRLKICVMKRRKITRY